MLYATSLDLSYFVRLNVMFKNLVTKSKSSFVAVKSLSINHFPSLDLAKGCEVQLDLFPNLEELSLENVNLESIGELNGFLGLRFQKLKLLQVSKCRQLKRLFSYQILSGSLPNLENINAVSCWSLEELFNFSSAPVGVSAESLLPKLSVIRLESLLQLWSGCSDGAKLEHLEQLEVKFCELLQKTLPIFPSNAGRIDKDPEWGVTDFPPWNIKRENYIVF